MSSEDQTPWELKEEVPLEMLTAEDLQETSFYGIAVAGSIVLVAIASLAVFAW